MAFRISLAKAKGAQLGSKSKAEEEAKAREEKNALDKVMADVLEEHGEESNVLGESERDHDAEEDVFVPTGSKRHYAGRQRSMKSGPGTLEPEPLDNFPRAGPGMPGIPGRFGAPPQSRFGGTVPLGPSHERTKQEENVYTTVVAKASNLPPTIDTRRVEELFADFPSLKVTKIEKIPPSGPASKGRPSASMKVIFDKDANARDLDDAMNKLNDKKYLGKGYYLHLDRYLGGRSVSTEQRKEPFGARWQAPDVAKGYAPPPDLGGGNRDRPREDTERLTITANAPPDIATLKLVHQTAEGVVLGGMEFEAALMQDPQVQEEERFAWLFDQKHPLNRYYRWCLHRLVCGEPKNEIFSRQGEWQGPKNALEDEYANELWCLNHEYDEPMDDDEEEERPQRHLPVGDNYPGYVDAGYGILSPRSRTLLIWLLSSLPPGTVMSEEIAAFSAFAVDHVNQGMDEVVHLLISNILEPFYFTKANTKKRPDVPEGEDASRRRADVQQLTTNALRIISDVVMTTSKESGVAYKYRSVIGTQLVERKVFEHLEKLPVQLQMGRMTERTYRDDVNNILKVWQDEHLFDKNTLEHLDNAFNSRKRQQEREEQERKQAEKRGKRKGNVVRKATAEEANDEDNMEVDNDYGTPINTMDGANDEPYDASLAQDPANPTNSASPKEQLGAVDEPREEVAQEVATKQDLMPEEVPGETAAARARRLRPKAEDMFASDEE